MGRQAKTERPVRFTVEGNDQKNIFERLFVVLFSFRAYKYEILAASVNWEDFCGHSFRHHNLTRLQYRRGRRRGEFRCG